MNPIEQSHIRARAGRALEHNAPLSPARARGLARMVVAEGGPDVLDVGCGTGGLLREVLACDPTWRGLGIDVAGPALAVAKARARAAGLSRRLQLRQVDARDVALRAPTVLCVGASHAVDGLAGLLRTVDADHLLLGEGFWHGTQPLAWREIFGPLPRDLEGLADACMALGWDVRHAAASDPWEFDAFEAAWGAAVRRTRLPGAAAFADARWQAYRQGYRGRLGFGWLWLAAA